jgi:hypothetical protein
MGKALKFILYTPWAAMLIIAALIYFGVLKLSYWWVILPLGIYLLLVAYIIISIFINIKNLQK